MPTKRNRAGQQQNYVPKGNGDASGEYGDNATGSNKHFTAFKKPDENEIKEIKSYYSTDNYTDAVSSISQYIREDDADRKAKKENFVAEHDYDKIDALHNSDVIAHKESVIKMANAYKRQAESGKPYYIINDAFYSHGSCYFSGERKGILITPETFRENTLSGWGTTWFHENGHLLDNTFINEKGERTNYSMAYKSKVYGVTLQDMLDYEFDRYFTKGRKEELINRIEEVKKQVYDEYGYDLEDMERQKRELLDQIKPFKAKLKEVYAELESRYKNGEFDYWAYLTYRDRAKERYWDATWQATQKLNSLISKKSKAIIEKEVAKRVYQNFSTITDMYSSLMKGRLHPEYGGYHDRTYWQSEESKRVKEFFAEAFSSYTLNNHHYQELKDAFPESIKIFEEIYKEIQ